MEKEKRFLVPQAEIVELIDVDIITTSKLDENNDEEITPYP